MIRKQVYLEPYHDTLLKKKAKSLGVTEAELVRCALDDFLRAGGNPKKDRIAWEAERKFITGRMKSIPKSAGQRTWKREELYDR